VKSFLTGFSVFLCSNSTRWLKNPDLNIDEIPPITQHRSLLEDVANGNRLPASLLSNPLDTRTPSSPLRNHTLGAREVYYQASTALKNVLGSTNVETEEELASLLEDLEAIRYTFPLHFILSIF
jgi:hypothetical protein